MFSSFAPVTDLESANQSTFVENEDILGFEIAMSVRSTSRVQVVSGVKCFSKS